jgi:zinc/manganese transport system substrate-binding protein
VDTYKPSGRALGRGRRLAGLLILAGLSLTVLLGTSVPAARAQTALTATTTLGIFADFARQVSGDRVEVIQLLGDAVDVHGYQLTPGDLQSVSRSQLLIYNGFGLEPFLGQVLGGGRAGLTRVELAEGLTPLMQGQTANPHFWLDPRLAMRYVERIRDAFSAADPAGSDTYHANAERYLADLRGLDAELESQLSTIPAQNRKLVTAHDAFAYLARRYGLETVAAVLSTSAREPSPTELIGVLRQVRAAGVRRMFAEPQLNPGLVNQVAREAGIQVLPLYSDAFPPDGSVRGYVDMMRANGRSLVEGLR